MNILAFNRYAQYLRQFLWKRQSKGVFIAKNFSDTDFQPLMAAGRRYRSETEAAAEPVEIGDDVFVCERVLMLKGVSIENGSVIGAGSVVTKNVPAGVICAGNPAKSKPHLGRVRVTL